MSADLNNAVHRLRQDGYGDSPVGRAARQADIEQLSHALGLAEGTIDRLVSDLAKEVNGPTFMGEPVLPHPDDAAVDRFARAMKLKLAVARTKGRAGWGDDEPGMQQRLSDMLHAHVAKGDPRDVANFCMFLHQRGESILASSAGAEVAAQLPAICSGTEREAATRKAWDMLRPALAPEGWTVGESSTFYGFFCWGWDAAYKHHEADITTPSTRPSRPSMQFTLGQAETLLSFFGGTNGDMTVEYFPADYWPDNPTAPPGLYVYCTEYPEEGAQWLGAEDNSEEIEPTWQHIPAETAEQPEALLARAEHAYKVACVARMAMETDPDGTPTIAVLNASIREGVRAVLQAVAPALTPPGCIVVPAEPTEKMLDACVATWQRRVRKKAESGTLLDGGNPRESFSENYKAMIAAAPSVPEGDREEQS